MVGNNKRAKVRVLSLHWGFSIGGVGKYSAIIDKVSKFAPIEIVTVCILSDDWHCDRQTLSELSAIEIKVKSRLDFSWIPDVIKEIAKLKPDVIMTHGFNAHFVAYVSRMVGSYKCPLIASYHGLYHAPTMTRKLVQPFLNGFTEFYLKRFTTGVISVSEHSRDYLVGRGLDSNKIVVVHNGIPGSVSAVNRRDEIRRGWGVDGGEMLMGVASRLDPVKGVGYLIEAFSRLKESYKSIKLIIVGTGMMEEYLKSIVQRRGLDNLVTFVGFRDDVADCLEAFDIFTLPSLAEYHSIGLLEAMRAAKPIVATDVGGNTESVRNEKEGLIVKPRDVFGLERAIGRLLESEELRLKLSGAARNRFEKFFTIDRMQRNTADWIMRHAG